MHRFAWLLAAGLAAPLGVGAQTVPAAPDTTTGRSAAWQHRTLLKLGTGLTRGFELGGFSGLSVPVVLGVERSMTPGWSVYANGFTGVRVYQAERFQQMYPGRRRNLLRSPGFDLGVRWYYNQAKRQAKGKPSGPLIGNYVALHSPTQFWYSAYRPNRFVYGYSALMLVWGLQRRVGGHGLLDAYVGAGVSNPRYFRYDDQTGAIRQARQLGIATELGIKFSLIP